MFFQDIRFESSCVCRNFRGDLRTYPQNIWRNMITVKFVSQDKVTKQLMKSEAVYFKELNFLVEDLIKTNREMIQSRMVNCRVFALIENEEDSNDNLFT